MVDYEVSTATHVGSHVSQLLRTIGNWSRPSGHGLYMFRSMFVASSTAALLGLATAAALGILTGGGGLGFLLGSCVGFVGGSIHYYQQCLRQALSSLDEHPVLMQLHLAYNFPWQGYQHLRKSQLRSEHWWRTSFARQGNLIAAWMSASAVLDEIHDRKTALILEAIVKREASKGLMEDKED
ncbi:uncharacterized protein GGS22DRAFT_85441 [Annulohypoxylon maeteangense]|uniref:uncharacterized protein n=1 Tax=Annulohypoxylon maeteangense TaxID=1927788 RepID=UPI00200737FC|nr:uncharacterized protein GGS22DRAFT_85441 [Annulohypoxylon maeteangense]KAI0880393.1 hypothetical protein GGS22DRAFT_85441 [Annulohypoxylon maeteangense]